MCKSTFLTVVILSGLCAAMVGCASAEKCQSISMPESLDTQRVTQVAVVVRDVEKVAKEWADLFGVEVPKSSLTDPLEKAHTTYRGRPTKGRAKLVFFKLDNLQLELIEPVGGPSTWREFLETNGEGVHHIAFEVKGTDKYVAMLEKKGMPLVQRGEWTAYTGGCYTYFDSVQKLGVALELLENY